MNVLLLKVSVAKNISEDLINHISSSRLGQCMYIRLGHCMYIHTKNLQAYTQKLESKNHAKSYSQVVYKN